MRLSIILSFLLIFSTSYLSEAQEKPSLDPFFTKLLGDWTVIAETKQNGEWVSGKESKATFEFLLDSTFVSEDVQIVSPVMTINMHIIFGLDHRSGKYRVIALDKEFGTMDVYKGHFQDKKLIVSNLDDDGFTQQDGSKLNFQLSYLFINDKQLQLYVEYTTNGGDSWNPYQKINYNRATD